MDTEYFLSLIGMLTGSPVKPLTNEEYDELSRALRDDSAKLDWTMFNELLLLVNKDRVHPPFYDRYFGRGCSVANLPNGVAHFQKEAMLCYGNFIYAYRALSRIKTDSELIAKLAEISRDPDAIENDFKMRSPKLLEIFPIARSRTFLVGYLSAKQRTIEKQYVEYLINTIAVIVSWDDLLQCKDCPEEDKRHVLQIVDKYRSRYPKSTIKDFADYLSLNILPALQANYEEIIEVQKKAEKNQDIYLTWDHMDIYFATSMRKRNEYEDLYDLVSSLMRKAELAQLNLRFFDPTQSFTKNRVNKGLVEALMLRRAKCTIYSVQDTDTLGKDSELASTLAQGKPVIAYVPSNNIEDRTNSLFNGDPLDVLERIDFLNCDNSSYIESLFPDDQDDPLYDAIDRLEELEEHRIFQSLHDNYDTDAIKTFKESHGELFKKICLIVATAEANLYDKRAEILRKTHPLGIQVNLATGVANGVLVVRNIEDCATLLFRILTNRLEYDLSYNEIDEMWYLTETVSNSPYRIVTRNSKLTNCFWNFYINT